MRPITLAATLITAATLGGVIAAVIVLAVTDGRQHEPRERGTIVTLHGELNFDAGPWCDTHHRFCIPEFEDLEDARALYMVHTHPLARQRACVVEWLPDQEIASLVDSPGAPPGAFRGRCIGNVWLEDGSHAFGPAPRDLDEFPVEVVTETFDGHEVTYLRIDTRSLTCGDWAPTYPREQIPDPACELAPPFD
jgi:hypothetical protein